MTSMQTNETRPKPYPTRTVKRAERAIACLPFQLPLFVAMRTQSVPLLAIAGESGVKQHYTQKPLSEWAIENDLMWLIQVGILRREVDGQGITDRFRLTPLGHQLVKQWERQGQTRPCPSLLDRLYNAVNRWLRLPI